MILTKGCISTESSIQNAGNFSTEMEGDIPWIILSLLLFMHVGEGKLNLFN